LNSGQEQHPAGEGRDCKLLAIQAKAPPRYPSAPFRRPQPRRPAPSPIPGPVGLADPCPLHEQHLSGREIHGRLERDVLWFRAQLCLEPGGRAGAF
jgi:hypothetical protein